MAKRPWNRRVGRPGTWKRRRSGFWWAPAAEDESSSTTAVDSCFTPFVSAIPADGDPGPQLLVIPILWNVAQNLSDAMVDKLDVAFDDGPPPPPGGQFSSFRHRPMTESWRVERISGHFTLQGVNIEQTDATHATTLVHMGILQSQVDADGFLIQNPQYNADSTARWLWKDQVPITIANTGAADGFSAYEFWGVPSVQHRSINIKSKVRMRNEHVLNLICQVDAPLQGNSTVFISPMLRAYVTRSV